MIKGFSAPLLSSLAISNRSVAGTWGCGWMRGEEEEQSRMLNMSSRPQRRRREGGQHGRLFTLCLSPLLRGSLWFFFFFLFHPSLYLLSLTFLFSLPLHPQLSSPLQSRRSFASFVLGKNVRTFIVFLCFAFSPECPGLVLSLRFVIHSV